MPETGSALFRRARLERVRQAKIAGTRGASAQRREPGFALGMVSSRMKARSQPAAFKKINGLSARSRVVSANGTYGPELAACFGFGQVLMPSS